MAHPAQRPGAGGRGGDDEGLIVDWLGVQATSGGVASSASGLGCIFALTAIRAGPYLVRRALGPRGARPKPSSTPADRR